MSERLARGDRALLAVLGVALVLGLAWFGFSFASGSKTSVNGMLVITQTKDGFRRVDPLGVDTEYVVKTPGTGAGRDAEGGRNTIRIRDEHVDVESSNCSNQVCVKHDPVRTGGGQIVCLPHGLVVEVVAHEEEATALQ